MNHSILTNRRKIFIALTASLLSVGSATATPNACSNTSFAPEVRYTVGSYPNSLAAGDFNADGIKDVAIADAHTPDDGVSVLLGTGTATVGRQSS